MFKFKSLAMEIWLTFGIIIGITLILTLMITPVVLNYFFIDELYENIEEAQNFIIEYNLSEKFEALSEYELDDKRFRFRAINHIFIYTNHNRINLTLPVSEKYLNAVKNQAYSQTEELKRYSKLVTGKEVFYVIRKTPFGYLVSYLGDTYKENLIKKHFKMTAAILLAVFLFSLLPSIIVARILAKPLVDLKQTVNKIAQRDWFQAINSSRKDEIGQLTNSIEQMRQKLIKQDKAQQSFLQNVSHELKTPVMVIQSYAQAIDDGIFPKGDLPSSIETIQSEAHRLEELIQKLLLLSKLDYLENNQLRLSEVNLMEIIKDVHERFRYRRPELSNLLDLKPVVIKADPEQIKIALENIMDNQLRYADKNIFVSISEVSTQSGENNLLLKFWNDGPIIDKEHINDIFEKFHKGIKGEYGLGLTIVKKIITLHKGQIWAENEENGVAFYIKLPK